jgi:membrane associated rhomboid family serine protease
MRPSRRQTQPFTRPWSQGRPTVTALLVGLHLGAYVAQWLMETIETTQPFSFKDWLRSCLALDGAGIAHHYYWQFATFGLLHYGFLHAAINLAVLFFAGREVERVIEPRAFIALYLLGNLFGGVAHWLAMPGAQLVGVSGGVAAVVAAYATLLPELELNANLFFAVPVRMRAKFLGFAVFAFGLLCWIKSVTFQGSPAIKDAMQGIGPVTIVAGCIFGWLFVRQLGFGRMFAWQRYFHARRQRAVQLARMSPAQFMAQEIDPILEKIARSGVAGLTRSERRLLAQAREKFGAKPAEK